MSLHINHNGQGYIIEQPKWYSELCQRTCRRIQELHEELASNIETMADYYGVENIVFEYHKNDLLSFTIKIDNEGNK